MIYGEMKNRVYNLLGVEDATNSGITALEVTESIDAVLPEVAVEVEDLLTYCQYDTALTGGVGPGYDQQYAIPEQYITAKQLILQRTTSQWDRLVLLNLEQWEQTTYGQSTTTGTPEYYKLERGATEWGNDPQRPGDIWFFPIPDAVYTFRFYYYQQPTPLTGKTDTDISELPPYMHMAVCYAAAEPLAIKRKDYELARLLNQKYLQAIDRGRMAANRPQRDRQNFVPAVMGYTDID